MSVQGIPLPPPLRFKTSQEQFVRVWRSAPRLLLQERGGDPQLKGVALRNSSSVRDSGAKL